jgi:hypothetical protein
MIFCQATQRSCGLLPGNVGQALHQVVMMKKHLGKLFLNLRVLLLNLQLLSFVEFFLFLDSSLLAPQTPSTRIEGLRTLPGMIL